LTQSFNEYPKENIVQSLDQIVANNAKVQAAYDASKGTDFAVSNHGAIVLLQPLTRAATEWAASNLPADRLTYGSAVAIEPRYLADIVDGIRANGLEVF
jgi:hypothetical protein